MKMKHKCCALLRKTTEIVKTGLQLTHIVRFVAGGKLKSTLSAASQAFK